MVLQHIHLLDTGRKEPRMWGPHAKNACGSHVDGRLQSQCVGKISISLERLATCPGPLQGHMVLSGLQQIGDVARTVKAPQAPLLADITPLLVVDIAPIRHSQKNHKNNIFIDYYNIPELMVSKELKYKFTSQLPRCEQEGKRRTKRRPMRNQTKSNQYFTVALEVRRTWPVMTYTKRMELADAIGMVVVQEQERWSHSVTHTLSPPQMRPLRGTDSDTTQVSDSEPEREAHRRDYSSSANSSMLNSPHRTPLGAISNTLGCTDLGTRNTLESRLSAIEGDLAEIKNKLDTLNGQKHGRDSFISESPPSSPLHKRRCLMHDRSAGGDSPVGPLEEPRIHRTSLMASTPEREEIRRCLDESLQQNLGLGSISRHRTRIQGKSLVRRVHTSSRT
ncbi:hypothetical protein C8R45DRAFT_932892 [Mycena sanguinolenta]|nr:hypothetical protein C8R45DRAFT_932892 [Mycena sanguinolenta]